MAAQIAVVENNAVKLGRAVDGDVSAALLRKKPTRPAAMMIEREGHVKTIEGEEGHPGDEPIDIAFQRAPRHAQESLDDNCEDGGFHAEENGFNPRQVAEGGIEHGKSQHDERAGQHEQQARHQSALDAVQAPARIGGELHGFRPRQQHAEIEGREKLLLAEPFALIDDFAVHEGDLARRTAKGEAADAGPDFCGFGERRRRAHGFTLLVGQLWVSSVASRHQR